MTSVLSVLEWNTLNLALFLIMLQYYNIASYFNDHSQLCEIVQLRNVTNVI